MKWVLYNNQVLSNGNIRLTYVELLPPPYGPGKPSINICNRKIVEGKNVEIKQTIESP